MTKVLAKGLLSIGPNTDVIPTLEKSSSAITPSDRPPITATPISVRSTISAVKACKPNAAPTTRKLILRLAEDSEKAMARMAATPARLSRMDVILSFTAATMPLVCPETDPIPGCRQAGRRSQPRRAWQFAGPVASREDDADRAGR